MVTVYKKISIQLCFATTISGPRECITRTRALSGLFSPFRKQNGQKSKCVNLYTNLHLSVLISGSLKNVFIFLRQFFITVIHVIMIICISLFHDHKIILNFESFKIKFTIRHSIVTRIWHFIVTKRLWKSSIAIYQMSKFTRSDDVCLFFQIAKSPPFYSMHISSLPC